MQEKNLDYGLFLLRHFVFFFIQIIAEVVLFYLLEKDRRDEAKLGEKEKKELNVSVHLLKNVTMRLTVRETFFSCKKFEISWFIICRKDSVFIFFALSRSPLNRIMRKSSSPCIWRWFCTCIFSKPSSYSTLVLRFKRISNGKKSLLIEIGKVPSELEATE